MSKFENTYSKAIVVLFEHLFQFCKSLKDIQNLLSLRLTLKYVWECTQDVNSHILSLIKNISGAYESELYVTNPDEAKKWLIYLNKLGHIAESLTSEKTIIAGSFALNMFLHLKHMKTFQYNDVDIYITNEELPWIIKELNIRKFHTNSESTSNNDSYIGQNKIMNKNTVINELTNTKLWSQYDWTTLLQNFPDTWINRNYIENVHLAVPTDTSELDCTINIIATKYLADSNGGPEFQAPNKEYFALNILSAFDMKQCKIAILNTKGTFYPKILCTEGTVECIQQRKIEFSEYGNTFSDSKTQLRRIKKYIERGFTLLKTQK